MGFLASDASAAEGVKMDWLRQFGTVGFDESLAVDADGNVYVAGFTEDVFSGQSSAGLLDAFVRKYDTDGNVVWTRQFGTSGFDAVTGIFVDASGVYIVGLTSGTLAGQTSPGGWDAFVRKYDSGGNVLWTDQFGPISLEILSLGGLLNISVDSSGVYVAGSTDSAISGETGSGDYDAFVRKYDSSGNVLWTRQFGTAGADIGFAVSVDSSGVYVVGQIDNGTFSGESNLGERDAFVRKYDTSGNALWTRQFGTGGNDTASFVSAGSAGVYISGFTTGAFAGETNLGIEDLFLSKYDTNGNELWTRQFGTAGYDVAGGVSVDSSGVYVAGVVSGALPGQTSYGGQDAFVRKYDTSGNALWTSQFGTSSNDNAFSAAAASSGVYVSGVTEEGTFPGQINFGQGDVFVAKFIMDSDGDGIYDEVDTSPAASSSGFSDGTTSGTITRLGDQTLSIVDSNTAASGVLATVEASGGPITAKINACGSNFFLDNSDQITITCGSVIAEVVLGTVEIEFIAASGEVATTTLDAGNTLTFDPGTLTFSADSSNTATVVILVNGNQLTLSPGESTLYVLIDIKPGSDDNSINLGSNGNVPVAILSSVLFDARNVDPATISLAGASVELRGKSNLMVSQEDVNGDGLLDLVVHIETNALELSDGATTAVLEGMTFGGESIRGSDSVMIIQ